MNQFQIRKSFTSGRVQLTKLETIEHYFFLVPILFLTFTSSYLEISGGFPIFEIAMLLLAAYFIYHKFKALEFIKIRIPHSQEDFESAVEATAIELKWYIEEAGNNFFVAGKRIGWQWDGLQITIIRNEDEIYFNSMVAPSISSNPFSFGWHNKNLLIFCNNLDRTLKGEGVVEKGKEKLKAEEIRLENEQ